MSCDILADHVGLGSCGYAESSAGGRGSGRHQLTSHTARPATPAAHHSSTSTCLETLTPQENALATPHNTQSDQIYPMTPPHTGTDPSTTCGHHSAPSGCGDGFCMHGDPGGFQGEVEESCMQEWTSVRYQCDVSCFGVTAAGGEVCANYDVTHDAGEAGPTHDIMDRRGGGGGWVEDRPNEALSYNNEIREECHWQTRQNQRRDRDLHDNEMRRGFCHGGGVVEGAGSGPLTYTQGTAPAPYPSYDVSRQESGPNDVTERHYHLHDVIRQKPCLNDFIEQDRLSDDVIIKQQQVDDVTEEGSSIDDVSRGCRRVGNTPGVQLPLMTIEIEKWLMGLFVSDEEDGNKEKKGTSGKKQDNKKRTRSNHKNNSEEDTANTHRDSDCHNEVSHTLNFDTQEHTHEKASLFIYYMF